MTDLLAKIEERQALDAAKPLITDQEWQDYVRATFPEDEHSPQAGSE